MVRVEVEGSFPAGLDLLWKCLEWHADDEVGPQIHPAVVRQRLLRSEGDTRTLEREVQYRGRISRLVWEFTYDPPARFVWSIVGGEGPIAPGSEVENHYEPAGRGTFIRTRGEIVLNGIPAMTQPAVARFMLDQAEQQDEAFLRRRGLL